MGRSHLAHKCSSQERRGELNLVSLYSVSTLALTFAPLTPHFPHRFHLQQTHRHHHVENYSRLASAYYAKGDLKAAVSYYESSEFRKPLILVKVDYHSRVQCSLFLVLISRRYRERRFDL